MSGILPTVRQPKEFADPGFASIPSISAQCSLPSLASLFWLLYKIEFSFHGRMEVRILNGYRSLSEEQRFVINVNMRLICIFWVKLFQQKKAKFCLLFRFKKSRVR